MLEPYVGAVVPVPEVPDVPDADVVGELGGLVDPVVAPVAPVAAPVALDVPAAPEPGCALAAPLAPLVTPLPPLVEAEDDAAAEPDPVAPLFEDVVDAELVLLAGTRPAPVAIAAARSPLAVFSAWRPARKLVGCGTVIDLIAFESDAPARTK